MNEKLKHHHTGYTPALSITTQQKDHKAFITLKDNGAGIQEKIIHKIFQPFFTTKPTGIATGLGLSLSYDMIKAHQGELTVESTEGEYAAFTI